MRTQRALRRLRPDPVDDALVLRLIELALKAPTSRNAQHWEFVLVKDRAVKARLARLYRMAWGLYGRLGRRLTAADPKMQRQLDGRAVAGGALRGDPGAGGGVSAWYTAGVASRSLVTSYYGSIYPAVQNLLLAARAAGLGAALITLPLWSTWLVRRALASALARHPLCHRAAGLAHGAVRADDPPSRRRRSCTSIAMATSRSRPRRPDGPGQVHCPTSRPAGPRQGVPRGGRAVPVQCPADLIHHPRVLTEPHGRECPHSMALRCLETRAPACLSSPSLAALRPHASRVHTANLRTVRLHRSRVIGRVHRRRSCVDAMRWGAAHSPFQAYDPPNSRPSGSSTRVI